MFNVHVNDSPDLASERRFFLMVTLKNADILFSSVQSAGHASEKSACSPSFAQTFRNQSKNKFMAISDGKFAVHLGKRIKFVDILNERDCVRVKPKGWMDKQVWKVINDILRVHQFAWLSNGRDSCWIKMMNGKE